jgi:hypothetical protein
MRGNNMTANLEFVREKAAFRLQEGLVSGTQVVLEWHLSGLLKT